MVKADLSVRVEARDQMNGCAEKVGWPLTERALATYAYVCIDAMVMAGHAEAGTHQGCGKTLVSNCGQQVVPPT